MRFYLDLNQTNLDWTKANVFEYKYIYYLARMIEERMTKVGIALGGNVHDGDYNITNSTGNNSTITWKFTEFTPNGLLTFHQLQMLYSTMIFLGTRVYLNYNNLDVSNWVHGDNRKYLNYSLKDLCEIANFDFFAHPFIPGERLDYYNQFLKPIHDCLSEFRYVWTNYFARGPLYYKNVNGPALPEIQVTHEGQTDTFPVNGHDREDFWSDFNNILSAANNSQILSSNIDTDGNPALSYSSTVTYEKWKWKGYYGEFPSYQNYECAHWTNLKIYYKTTIRPMQRLMPSSPYELKLLHCTNDPNFYNDPKRLKYFESNYNYIIDYTQGTIPQTGFPTIEIELFQNGNIAHDLTNIPIEQFWYSNSQGSSSITNPNVGMRETYIAACYRPILIADYYDHFILF